MRAIIDTLQIIFYIRLRLQLVQQTAKDGMQLGPIRHHLTSLAPTDQVNDVMNDVSTRDSKRSSVDVTDQTPTQRDVAVCVIVMR